MKIETPKLAEDLTGTAATTGNEAAANVLRLEDVKNSDDIFVILLKCAGCGIELNRSKVMTGKEIYKSWTSIVITSGFNAGSCSNGCRSTFSDLNINTKLEIVKEA